MKEEDLLSGADKKVLRDLVEYVGEKGRLLKACREGVDSLSMYLAQPHLKTRLTEPKMQKKITELLRLGRPKDLEKVKAIVLDALQPKGEFK